MSVKLKEITSILVRNYMAGINTMLLGRPGIGKTETVGVFVTQMEKRVQGFKAWMFYAPTMSPMDIQASAPNWETHLLELFNNAALPNAYTTPDAKGIVFLGELPSADPATAKLLQKYVNREDMSGVLRMPDGIVVVADGNRIEDKSGVQQQGRAFMSRFEQHDVYSDAEDNIAFAQRNSWHPMVQTFFKDNAHLIDNYDEVFETSAAAQQRSKTNGRDDQMSEEGKRGIWANMRSWERLSRKEYVAEQLKSPVTLAEDVANLGSGVGAKYNAHKQYIHTLASYEEVIGDPDKVKIPEKMDERYALCMVVALKAKEADLKQVRTFGERMPLDLQAALLRNMAARKGFDLASGPEYAKWIANPRLTSLLNGGSRSC